MEHVERVPIKKPSSSHRYPHPEQHGLTMGIAKLRDARLIRLSWTVQLMVLKRHLSPQPGRQVTGPDKDPETTCDFETIHVTSSQEGRGARDW